MSECSSCDDLKRAIIAMHERATATLPDRGIPVISEELLALQYIERMAEHALEGAADYVLSLPVGLRS